MDLLFNSCRIGRRSIFISFLSPIVLVIASCGLNAGPVTYVMRFAAKTPGNAALSQEEMDSLLIVVNSRLRGGGTARKLNDREIIVDVFGPADASRLGLLNRLVTTHGRFEFRVVVPPDDDSEEELVRKARQLLPNEKRLEHDGALLAEWVQCEANEFAKPDDGRIVTRSIGKELEALVYPDTSHVAESLEAVSKTIDAQGKPALAFTVNDKGAIRLKQLTTENLPTDHVRHLGIVFGDRLIAAPAIVAPISKQGQVSGPGFTDSELDLIVTILEEGWLPVPLRAVSVQPAKP